MSSDPQAFKVPGFASDVEFEIELRPPKWVASIVTYLRLKKSVFAVFWGARMNHLKVRLMCCFFFHGCCFCFVLFICLGFFK